MKNHQIQLARKAHRYTSRDIDTRLTMCVFRAFFIGEIMNFPAWKPHYRTEEKFYGVSRGAYRALRSASSSFIKMDRVRSIIGEKSSHSCVDCGGKENLCVDHIISVYRAFKDKTLIKILNTKDNLQILCIVCNSKKSPQEVLNG